MKAVVAAFNQEKALVGAFSVITNLWMELFETLLVTLRGYNAMVGTLWPVTEAHVSIVDKRSYRLVT